MTKTRTLFFRPLAKLLAIGLLLAPTAFAQVTANVSSRFLARGEFTTLQVIVSGNEPEIAPIPPEVPNVKIEGGRQGMIPRGVTGRTYDVVYQFTVSSYEIGKHVIPPINMLVNGERTKTPPVEFWVFDPDQLELSQVEAGGRMVTYFAAFQAAKLQPYEGETVPTEIKIYIPLDLARSVQDWGVPEFERDNVTAWRFEPTESRGRVNILGKPYLSLAYPSTLTPSKAGKVGIGPATLRLTTLQNVMGGFSRSEFEETYLKIPKLELDAVPLPPGAPEGFENAIGQFEIQSTISQNELVEGESIAVNLSVRGSGNLDTLRAPKLVDAQGWKVYDPISIPRGDERRWLSGTSLFHQGLLPLEMKPSVPAFQLVYFDPADGAYKTVTTEPIALIMKPGAKVAPPIAGPTPALPLPLESMNDILGLMNPAQLTVPLQPAFPAWLGHAIGALAALILIAKAAWMRYAPLRKKDPIRESKTKELQTLSKIPASDDIAFLKAAGSYVERWHGENPSPELQSLLIDRDRICFRPDKPAEALPRGRRDEILKTLRKAIVLGMIFLSLGFHQPAEAADLNVQAREAYDSAKYEEAIKLWQSAGDYKTLSADVLYNIGNASYRMGAPGHAALYYRRALVKNSTHPEARQNLRFIERKYGSITVQYTDYQHLLAKFPASTWINTFWIGVWITGLSLLVFPATRPGANIRIAAVTLLIAGPFIASFGGLGWRYYPNDSIFAPIERQAVIVAENTVLHTDAARTAPEVINAPQGSLCEILRVSGKWAYISFASKTRGWVPVSTFEKLVPDATPGVPKIVRPAEDESNA